MTPPTSILTAQVLTEGDDQVILLPECVWFTCTSVGIRREGNEVVLSEKLEKLDVPAGNLNGSPPTDSGAQKHEQGC